jgi:uncharacterized membrane protein
MDIQKLLAYYHAHTSEINGALIGFVFSVCVLLFGFFQTIFVSGSVFLGFYIGKKLSQDQEYIKNLLDKILPPGINR